MSRGDWSGQLQRADAGICGTLRCEFTGWTLALSAASVGRGQLTLEARFQDDIQADAAPWTEEADLGQPHVDKGDGYDCRWHGELTNSDGKAWKGWLEDRYRGRLELRGKVVRAGFISLSAVAVERHSARQSAA